MDGQYDDQITNDEYEMVSSQEEIEEGDILSQDPSQTDIDVYELDEDEGGEAGGNNTTVVNNTTTNNNLVNTNMENNNTINNNNNKITTTITRIDNSDNDKQTYAHLVVFTAHKAGMNYKSLWPHGADCLPLCCGGTSVMAMIIFLDLSRYPRFPSALNSTLNKLTSRLHTF